MLLNTILFFRVFNNVTNGQGEILLSAEGQVEIEVCCCSLKVCVNVLNDF